MYWIPFEDPNYPSREVFLFVRGPVLEVSLIVIEIGCVKARNPFPALFSQFFILGFEERSPLHVEKQASRVTGNDARQFKDFGRVVSVVAFVNKSSQHVLNLTIRHVNIKGKGGI